MQFLVKKINPIAIVPTRGSDYAAGYDLYAVEDVCVLNVGRALVSIGIAVSLPEGTYGRIASRSGLSLKHGIEVGAGVIDQDYRGEIKVLLYNHDVVDAFNIKAGDRIAQLVIEKCFAPLIVEVPELYPTQRGSGGYGSTGGFYTLGSPIRKQKEEVCPMAPKKVSKCACDGVDCNVCAYFNHMTTFGQVHD